MEDWTTSLHKVLPQLVKGMQASVPSGEEGVLRPYGFESRRDGGVKVNMSVMLSTCDHKRESPRPPQDTL